MTLKELGTLWGNPIVKLKGYAKKYRIGSIFLYVLDVFILGVLTFIMYKQRSTFNIYMFVMVMFAILFTIIFNLYLDTNQWEAFKFYKKHANNKIEIKKYKVDAGNLYSIIYCMNYKRLKQDKEYEDYLETIINACNEDWTFSKSLMKYMEKYEDAETGNLEVYTIKKGKKTYFIDYVETIKDKNKVEEEREVQENELDNEGSNTGREE